MFFWGRKFVRLFVYLRRVCWVEWGTSGQVFPLDNLPWYFKGFPIPFLIFIQLITLSWFIKTPRDILKGFSSLSHLHPIDDLVWSRIWSLSLVDTLKLQFGQDFEIEVWSIVVQRQGNQGCPVPRQIAANMPNSSKYEGRHRNWPLNTSWLVLTQSGFWCSE